MLNKLPYDIQQLVYWYMHQSELEQVLTQIQSINIQEFFDDNCQMCYSRNIIRCAPMGSWVRCKDILTNMKFVTIIGNDIYYCTGDYFIRKLGEKTDNENVYTAMFNSSEKILKREIGILASVNLVKLFGRS